MKARITYKDGHKLGDNVIAVSYCGLQSLLSYERPIAYSAGIYGWGCDYYIFDYKGRRVVISTGYAPQGEHAEYETMRKYEKMSALLPYNRDWEADKAARRQLINDFINEVLGNE